MQLSPLRSVAGPERYEGASRCRGIKIRRSKWLAVACYGCLASPSRSCCSCGYWVGCTRSPRGGALCPAAGLQRAPGLSAVPVGGVLCVVPHGGSRARRRRRDLVPAAGTRASAPRSGGRARRPHRRARGQRDLRAVPLHARAPVPRRRRGTPARRCRSPRARARGSSAPTATILTSRGPGPAHAMPSATSPRARAATR